MIHDNTCYIYRVDINQLGRKKLFIMHSYTDKLESIRDHRVRQVFENKSKTDFKQEYTLDMMSYTLYDVIH